MAVDFKILLEHNLTYVSCSAHVSVSETLAAFGRYSSHPDYRHGQTQLVDLSRVGSYERDFTKIMSLQAHQADYYLASENRPFLIFVAPNKLTHGMAMAALRSWKNLDVVVPLIVSTIEEAAEVLSLNIESLEELREPV